VKVRSISFAVSAALLALFPQFGLAQVSTVAACSVADPPSGCGNNMWALQVTIQAQNGAYVHVPDPGCMNDASQDIAKLLQAATLAAAPKLALFSGPISQLVSQPINQHMRSQGGDLGKLISPYAKNGALCAPVVGVIPVAAEVAGFRLLAAEAGTTGFGRCSPGADCGIGWSKFQAQPVESKNSSIRTYSTVFMNWSHNRARQAQMIIFYKLPTGEKPLLEL
jgi:hypothetical protein